MSIYAVGRITKPPHFRLGPLARGRGTREPYVIGFDSEAEDSRPFTLQFSLPDEPEGATRIIPVALKKYAALHEFMKVLHAVCSSRKREYLIYGFNLAYEFTQLFHDFPDEARTAADFAFDYVMRDGASYRWTVMTAKRQYAVIVNRSTRMRVRFLDAHAFYSTSLDKAARMVKVGEKLGKPPVFRRRDWQQPEFQAYARRDAYITRLLSERIIEMHEQYDVATCISAPHFASSVFRRRFLGDVIPHPEERLEQYGLWAYHGGKNGYYLDGPQTVKQVTAVDIRSAYPEAMRQLPDVEQATWRRVYGYKPGTHSLWRAVVEYTPCVYRGVQTEAGHWLTTPGRHQVYATGYEIDAMLRRGEVRIIRAVGYVMDGPTGGPLARYVDEFYALKSGATTETERVTAKLMLNSLYGKFFQKVAVGAVGAVDWETGEWVASAPDQATDWIAGGLYHPPIAALITGFVRARMHALEHEHEAMMTSTDGLFAVIPPGTDSVGTALGMLDVSYGTLRIWRERLYLFDAEHPVEGCRDPTCTGHKAALHGYRGDPRSLARVPLRPGRYTYTAQQVVTLGMSTRRYAGRRHEPGSFVMLPFGLDV